MPTSIGYIQCVSISKRVIDRLFVETNKKPLIKNKTPNEATRDESLPNTISAPTAAPTIAPVQTPPKKAIAGSIPAVTNNAKTYAERPYVEANERSISPEVTKKTSGMTINNNVGIITNTDWWRFGRIQTSGAPIKNTIINRRKYPILPIALPFLWKYFLTEELFTLLILMTFYCVSHDFHEIFC